MQTVFVGGGLMAEAMLARGLAQGVLAASDVCVSEPIQARREYLAAHYGVATTSDNRGAVADASLVVIAVKPQHFDHVCEELAGTIGGDQTVLSIMAGVPVARIMNGLRHQCVVRVMPNTPARIGAGVSVWTATAEVSDQGRDSVRALLSVLGREVFVADESHLDMATALSGSGPAYVFAFMEALIDAGVAMGFAREVAATLVLETIAGSAQLAKETGDSPTALREMVTSPGGTTAAALRALEKGGFRSTVIEGVFAALDRAHALGGKN